MFHTIRLTMGKILSFKSNYDDLSRFFFTKNLINHTNIKDTNVSIIVFTIEIDVTIVTEQCIFYRLCFD